MRFRAWTGALTLGAAALFVGCTQEASDGASAGGGAGQGSSVAGASDGGDGPGSSIAGASDGGDGPGSSAGAPDGGDAPGPLSCMGVLQCAGACPDSDVDACVQACVDRTSARSQPVTSAFIQCIADNECADSTCIQEKCVTQLSACVADDDSVVQGTPSSDPAPAGAVPTELVGLWSQVGLSTGTSYEFEADGTTTQTFLSETSYGCDLKTELSSSGVTTVTGDTLVYHRAEGTVLNQTCGTIKTTPLAPADLTYQYTLGTFDDGRAKLSLYFVSADGSRATSPIELHR